MQISQLKEVDNAMGHTIPRVLIIDDEPEILDLLETLVSAEGYAVAKARTGIEALQQLADTSFDAIISDVHMPEMNGYHLVLKVRDNPQTKNIPFIFVSQLTSLDEMIQGYELGADEYIKKPIDPDKVILKLNYIIENKLRHSDLNQQLNETQKVAMQAMSYSSYLGQILQFMQNSLTCNNFDDLAREIFASMDLMGLASAIQFFTSEGTLSYTPEGQMSPLESNIIELARNKGRFFDFNNRTLINHDEFSLLLKNMPIEQQEQYGQYKDILGNLCNAIEARVKFILSQKAAEQKTQVMLAANDIITDVNQTFSEIQSENLLAIESMMDDIEESFLSLGLTEAQEETLRKIVSNYQSKTDMIYNKAYALASKFASIHESLTKDLN